MCIPVGTCANPRHGCHRKHFSLSPTARACFCSFQIATVSAGAVFPCGITSTVSYLYVLLCVLPLALRKSGDSVIWTARSVVREKLDSVPNFLNFLWSEDSVASSRRFCSVFSCDDLLPRRDIVRRILPYSTACVLCMGPRVVGRSAAHLEPCETNPDRVLASTET